MRLALGDLMLSAFRECDGEPPLVVAFGVERGAHFVSSLDARRLAAGAREVEALLDTLANTSRSPPDSPRKVPWRSCTPVEAPTSASSASTCSLLGQASGLSRFYAPTKAFVRIGSIACPLDPGVAPPPTPYSMGVSRSGSAYVLFKCGQLFRLSTATAQCAVTTFAVGQHGCFTSGMGYVVATRGPGKTLYITIRGTRRCVAPARTRKGPRRSEAFVPTPSGRRQGW